jgi:hypothetical protein
MGIVADEQGNYCSPEGRSPDVHADSAALLNSSFAPPDLARDPRILDRFTREARMRGLVGEERNAQILYLVLTSRLLDQQVSAGVKGHSSSGKSYGVATVVEFFPADAVIEFTAMSERALVYSEREFKHRTLVIYEVVALREGADDNLTSYFVRSLLSEGRINYEVVERRDGAFTTRTIVKEGPTNLVFTTTQTKVHAENETRVLSLNTDDSKSQTERVLLELANESGRGSSLDDWHELQRWLEHAEHRVTIPYARQLAKLVPGVAVRLRRDFGSLLALIRAHAMLHQETRGRDAAGQVVASVEDYAVVRDLVGDVLAQGVAATVSATVRGTVETVAALARSDGIQAREVADHLDIDKSNASRRLRQAADEGYVRNLEGKRGRPARWVVGDPMPDDAELLPEPARLGCAVARQNEGMKNAPEPPPEPTRLFSTPKARATAQSLTDPADDLGAKVSDDDVRELRASLGHDEAVILICETLDGEIVEPLEHEET